MRFLVEPIYYPQKMQDVLAEHHEKAEEIKANYNFLFNRKEETLKQKYRSEFDRIVSTSRSHATLLSDFLKPFISDKNDSKYKNLKNISLLLLDPLYSENIRRLKTLDAVIGGLIDDKIKKIFLIEAKSSKVDDEYKEYDKYHTDKIKKLLIQKIREKYPRLDIDIENLEIFIFILVY